jgi:CheY-like chemotaxis protein
LPPEAREIEEIVLTSRALGRPDLDAVFFTAGPSRIRGKRILYVDDDPCLRRVTSAVLREAGAICLPAGTHDQAVAFVDADPGFALAILDFEMPDGDVGHLVKRLRSVRALLPLIGTSGGDRRDDFAERGVTRFLEKPWQLADLEIAVGW